MKWMALSLLLSVSAAQAEIAPHPGSGDPHIQQVEYDPEQVVALQAATGFALTIELSPDERVENVALGNSSAWQVQVNHRGDRLFIKPVTGDVTTNLTVLTDARRYDFILRPATGQGALAPYVVRFVYPPPASPVEAAGPIAPTQYRLHGSKALWPRAMSDDGQFTSIIWPGDQAMPAVYRVDARGAEMLVNGIVKDGAYVIEGVSPTLLFRRGKDEASATRKLQKARH